MMVALLATLGVAAGGPLRHLVEECLRRWRGRPSPWDALAANVGGCLVLGFLAGVPTEEASTVVVGALMWGAVLTYATFGDGTVALVRAGHPASAMASGITSFWAGFGAALCGLAFAEVIIPP